MNITIFLDCTMIKAKEITGMIILNTPEEVVKNTGMLWWKKYEKVETKYWTLQIEYLGVDGKNWKFTSRSSDYGTVQKMFNEAKKQIMAQDASFIDRAFEEQVLGSKDS